MNITIRKEMEVFLRGPLEAFGHTIKLEGDSDAYECDVFIGYGSNTLNKDKYPNLKVIQLLSAGFDSLDLDRLKNEGVSVLNARGIYSEAIAEYVVANILSVLKETKVFQHNQEHKIWDRTISLGTLKNKTVYYLGTGSINEEVLARLKGFKTHNIGFNSNGRDIEGFDKCYPLSELNSILNKADVIISSLPHNDATIKLFTNKEFDLIKEGAIFVNVGRGSLLDEKSLENHTKHLKGIILDVFETEPVSEESFLWNEANVIMTPHISFMSQDNQESLLNLVLSNVKNIEQAHSLINQVI